MWNHGKYDFELSCSLSEFQTAESKVSYRSILSWSYFVKVIEDLVAYVLFVILAARVYYRVIVTQGYLKSLMDSFLLSFSSWLWYALLGRLVEISILLVFCHQRNQWCWRLWVYLLVLCRWVAPIHPRYNLVTYHLRCQICAPYKTLSRFVWPINDLVVSLRSQQHRNMLFLVFKLKRVPWRIFPNAHIFSTKV